MGTQKKSIKHFIRGIIYLLPGAKALWERWIKGKPGLHEFSGWGMTTNTFPPWQDPANELAQDFIKANEAMVQSVLEGQFKLAQWETVKDKRGLLRGLMWRHYIVFWSARFAELTGGSNIAECGVCDGLTAYFAISALKNKCRAFLYDSWQAMSVEYLLESEKDHVGDYGYLAMEETMKNLSNFNTVFIRGFIPESFKGANNPETIMWLHIDLNSALPTLESLKHFFEKLSAGGVILFDDYAGRGFTDTKVAIDTFLADKKGTLLHIPTGQAIFFKH